MWASGKRRKGIFEPATPFGEPTLSRPSMHEGGRDELGSGRRKLETVHRQGQGEVGQAHGARPHHDQWEAGAARRPHPGALRRRQGRGAETGEYVGRRPLGAAEASRGDRSAIGPVDSDGGGNPRCPAAFPRGFGGRSKADRGGGGLFGSGGSPTRRFRCGGGMWRRLPYLSVWA